MAGAAAAATIISGAAAKLQSWPKSALAGSAQKAWVGAVASGAGAGEVVWSSAARRRLPRMKGAARGRRRSLELEVELERREEGEEEEKAAGVVPVPVAARMDGSAWRSSHSMVWPSDLSPSSRVSAAATATRTMRLNY